MPPFLLGYTYNVQAPGGGVAGEVESSIGQGSTFLSIFVTIEPSLALPEPFKERLATNEEEELINRADLWQMNLEKKFPKRIFRTTVMDTNGRNVFVTRFFRGIKPPPEVLACQSPEKAMFRITIKKNPGLGFSIAGGIGSHGNPFREEDIGIFVTKVVPNGPAAKFLQPGDKILEVNKVDFEVIDHNQAVAVLKKNSIVTLLMERVQKVNVV